LEIVNDWDFPETRAQNPCLPEFLLETWQGFVFINLDTDAAPLSEFLGPLEPEFDRYAMESRYRAAGIRMVLPCNWKVAAASFPETYHVPWTHPQIGSWVSDVDSTLIPLGLHGKCVNARRPSPNNAFEVDDETYLAEQLGFLNREAMDTAMEGLENGFGAREILAQVQRQRFLDKGFDFADCPNDEFVDGKGYWIFPNAIAYVGLGTAGHVLRFLPNGRDPNTCVAELWLMTFPDDANAPMANVPMSSYPLGTSVTEAFEDSHGFHPLGPVLDQDLSNLESIQRGLQSAHYPGVSFGLYQESLIRNFEEALDGYLERFDKPSR
jgi:phenylpropionate dioxygenase-like ring-hydroxylating dioxygenase large terminal subunit